jgi:hypothetical protein
MSNRTKLEIITFTRELHLILCHVLEQVQIAVNLSMLVKLDHVQVISQWIKLLHYLA